MKKRYYALAPLALLTAQCEPQCAPQTVGIQQTTSWSVDWNRIAQCESGGNWSHGPVTNSSGTYSGGLMIGHRWWPGYGGREFATYPYQATKAEQIIVAERIVDDIGADRGWQCYPYR